MVNGGQVLLMLPEIALTAQIVARLESQIGKGLLVYHSRVNDHQRVEVWNAALYASKLFIGARSALFLPFSDLQLIIVDEEHDRSYKQDSPNPKYNGRDSAVKLSILTGAKVVLGSATPSLESRYNCETGKYGYIPLTERYGPAVLPQIEIIDLKKAYKEGRMKQQFSTNLISAIQEAMARKEQTIIFQNRRGYAPILKCQTCGWTAECPSCDITLTYHQRVNDLKCHYCGYRQRKPQVCPNCGSHEISLLGAGTERLEETIEELIPGVRVARFDYDTTRSKRSQDKILTSFKDGKVDVLVGTQM
ncbi:MAG: primosomal protein N', partial [Bacteroidota bacterium]